MPRRPEQGPADFARSVCNSRKVLAPDVAQIIDLYILLRYGGKGGDKDLKRLQTLVKQFNPKHLKR